MAVGRPLVHTPEEVKERAAAFFAECDAKKEPYTITGLALALGMTSRKQLIEYSERAEFRNTIRDAKLRCEQYAEKRLFGTTPTGAIFALKNYGWTDKTETEISGPGGTPVQIAVLPVRPVHEDTD
jgi:hypothetical protein